MLDLIAERADTARMFTQHNLVLSIGMQVSKETGAYCAARRPQAQFNWDDREQGLRKP